MRLSATNVDVRGTLRVIALTAWMAVVGAGDLNSIHIHYVML